MNVPKVTKDTNFITTPVTIVAILGAAWFLWDTMDSYDDNAKDRYNALSLLISQGQQADLDARRMINNQVTSNTELINALNRRIVGNSPEGFHRADAKELCDETARKNDGFECADPYTLPSYRRWRTRNPQE